MASSVLNARADSFCGHEKKKSGLSFSVLFRHSCRGGEGECVLLFVEIKSSNYIRTDFLLWTAFSLLQGWQRWWWRCEIILPPEHNILNLHSRYLQVSTTGVFCPSCFKRDCQLRWKNLSLTKRELCVLVIVVQNVNDNYIVNQLIYSWTEFIKKW